MRQESESERRASIKSVSGRGSQALWGRQALCTRQAGRQWGQADDIGPCNAAVHHRTFDFDCVDCAFHLWRLLNCHRSCTHTQAVAREEGQGKKHIFLPVRVACFLRPLRVTHNCVFCRIFPYLVKDNDVKCSRQQASSNDNNNCNYKCCKQSMLHVSHSKSVEEKLPCRDSSQLCMRNEWKRRRNSSNACSVRFTPFSHFLTSPHCQLPCQPFVSCQTTITTKQTVESISISTSSILYSVNRQQSRPEHGRCRGCRWRLRP